ncbi:MAG: condensation domain-containing protein, partial [Vicinamibacterales bacterium]
MSAGNIEDVYELSPMQQGMLFHLLYAPHSGVYNVQNTCVLHGLLDVERFKRVWQRIVDRHSILRTSFHWQSVARPLQVVHRTVEVVWDEEDLRPLAPEARGARVQAVLRDGRFTPFDLSRVPLMRLALLRVADDRYQMMWNLPHLLADGWSVTLILKDVFTLYTLSGDGVAHTLPPTSPYKEYIEWVGRQDPHAAARFWQGHLAGFDSPTTIGEMRAAGGWADRPIEADERQVILPESTSRAIEALARQYRVTLSTLFHGVWALLLAHYSGRRDVVFGSVVSGRPPEVQGADMMVGMFINTLPVRAVFDPAASFTHWLARLQQQLVDMRQFDYTPLVEIQKHADVAAGVPLFST